MTKIELIKLIKENENRIDKSVFDDDDKGGKKLGTNQFRELAGICASAECYEEIELLIEYNIAKNTVKYKNSWAKEKYGVSVGRVIIDCMEEVKDKSNNDVMKNLSLFFGYMYWKARIWAKENGDKGNRNNSKDYKNKNNNYQYGGKGK